MDKIFNESYLKNLPKRSLEKSIDEFLNCGHPLSMSATVIEVGLKINSDYNKFSKLLLSEMGKEIHFTGVRLGITSAWTIAVILAENLKPEDYPKLKEQFDRWDEEEKKSLLLWLKDFPDHLKILQEGKL